MQIQFTDAFLYDSASGTFFPGTMTVADGRIVAVTPADMPAPAADQIISLGGRRVAPGLIDVHTHGRAGHDFNSADENAMRTMAASYARSGVTSLMPTLASSPVEELKQRCFQ